MKSYPWKNEPSLGPLRCKLRLGKAAPRDDRQGRYGINRAAGYPTALRTRLVWWTALPLLLGVPGAALAQSDSAASAPAPTDTPPPVVEFSADQVIYDSEADLVTATGEVRMNREGNY